MSFAVLVASLILLLPSTCQGAPRTFAPRIVVSPDSPATRELFESVARVPGVKIEELIRSGADVAARQDGYTPLMRTVFRVALLDVPEAMTRTGYRAPLLEKSAALRALDILVAAGADVDAPQDDDGKNALTALAEWRVQKDFANFEALFERLLDLGSNPEYRDNAGRTALMAVSGPPAFDREQYLRRFPCPEKEAARAERTLFVLERLLRAGGSVRATDNNGETALMRAFSGGWNSAAVHRLIDAGSNIGAKDKNGVGVFMKALEKLKRNKSDSWLADRCHIKPYPAPPPSGAGQPRKEDTVLLRDDDLFASLAALDRLMDLGIAPDALRTSDDTALAVAARTEGTENTEERLRDFLEDFLKRYEWSPDEKNEALLRSVSYHQLNCGRIETLVRRGADINARDIAGKNVLMLFLTNAYPETNLVLTDLKRLIALGLDVGARDNEGSNLLTLDRYVPLFPDVVNILIGEGIDVNTPNDAGIPPLLAQMRNAPGRTFDSIRRPVGGPAPLSGYWLCYPEAIRILLEAGANPNLSDRDGNRPLILSLNEREDNKVMTVLLEHGADPNVTGSDGQTPLMLLAQQSASLLMGFRGFADIFSVLAGRADMLLAHGAGTDIRDARGKTVWDYAAENGDRRMLRCLIAAAKKHHRNPPEWVLRMEGTP